MAKLPEWLPLWSAPTMVWDGETWKEVASVNLDNNCIELRDGSTVDGGAFNVHVRPCCLLQPKVKLGDA